MNKIPALLFFIFISCDLFGQTAENIFVYRSNLPQKKSVSKDTLITSLGNEVQVYLDKCSDKQCRTIIYEEVKVKSFNIFLQGDSTSSTLERSYKTNRISQEDTALITKFIQDNSRTIMYIEDIIVNVNINDSIYERKIPGIIFKIE